MAQKDKEKPMHPGQYIKEQVLPAGLSVKGTAELLGVGRPALSNLLNEKAALSPEMALRLEKTFRVGQEKLLQVQAQFDQYEMRARERDIPVRAYVPSFLKITARQIENWADDIEARSLLAVLLRKLVHSTGQNISHIDFPGYSNAERKGWDGQVKSGIATPWIPQGESGWEFGCDKQPKKKAESDYAARIRVIPRKERAEITFVFVTPRRWDAKNKWAEEKAALNEWKSVRAYDASDLEQWLEQSIPAQGWLANKMLIPSEGVHTLEEYWNKWASVTEPELPREIFELSIEAHKSTLVSWIKEEPSSPLVVSADSKDEALAFLSCIFDANDLAAEGYKDRAVVFSSAQNLQKLASSSSEFIPIIFTEEVERESGGIYKKMHTVIIRPRNAGESEPDIALDLLNHNAFEKALAAMGIKDDRADTLARESGYSPTILRRRLSKNPAIRKPLWAQDTAAVRSMIPMMLVGAWHPPSQADCEILKLLAGLEYSEIEKEIANLLKFDDCPVWSLGRFRGVVSKIDAFFAVQTSVTEKDINEFLFAAEIVLSERDPALDLSEGQRWAAGIYGKTRDHSGALRKGICETLVLLAVHGNNLFKERLGIDVAARVDVLIRRLLTPLTPEKLFSQSENLPLYAEAAPKEFLKIIEEDLQSGEPQIYAIMRPADSGLFGGGCPRTGLLWALENLAWKPEQLVRVCLILAKLAERKIDDNWMNKPDNSLRSIFRSWLPQTAASLEERKKALETLTKRFPLLGWQICREQFYPHSQVGHYNYRPRWRSDACGAGQGVTGKEQYGFARKAIDLVLAWPNHTEDTLDDLIENLQGLPEEDQAKVWELVDKWQKTNHDDHCRAQLRERIRRFAFTRRASRRGLQDKTRDRAREFYTHLTPKNPIIRHQWLFATHWVQESYDELEDVDFDYTKRQEKIRKLRTDALREIWEEKKFEGITSLLHISGAASSIGYHLADGVIKDENAANFLQKCFSFESEDMLSKIDELVWGFMDKLDDGLRRKTTPSIIASLPQSKIIRFIKCMPFRRETWHQLQSLGPEMAARYWQEIVPPLMGKETAEINEVIDKLLEVKRPRAAFHSVHVYLEEVETSRLKRLLNEIGTCDFEPAGTYPLNPYYISSALEILQGRSGVTEDDMARLEFMFIRALDHSEHGIPHLERQIAKSPSLFMQVLALTFKRSDDGIDPPEWRIDDLEQKEAVFSAAYRLLDRIKYIPGTDQTGKIDMRNLKAWLTETRALCEKYAREKIGD
ncbi:MAG: HigA family addiction module antitoxin, partial [Acidobacteriota bacterium]